MAKAKKWCCTTCGSPYTRAASCRAHIHKKHGDLGLAIPETEYIIGRQTGTFAIPIYVPGIAKRPASEPKERSFFERLWEEQLIEFWREAARITARNVFKPAATFAAGTYFQQPASPFAIDKELFGMTAYICPNCYAMKPRFIYYNAGDLGGSVETGLTCISDTPDYITQMKQSREEYVALASKGFQGFLKTCVDAWTNRSAIIVALEVIDPARTSNNITFVGTRWTGQKISITVQYSEEKCVELDPASTGAWVLRAIKDTRTVVNDKELTEFLEKTLDSTFAFFKLREAGVEHIYLLAVGEAGNKGTVLSAPQNEVAVTIPPKQKKEQEQPNIAALSSILEDTPNQVP